MDKILFHICVYLHKHIKERKEKIIHIYFGHSFMAGTYYYFDKSVQRKAMYSNTWLKVIKRFTMKNYKPLSQTLPLLDNPCTLSNFFTLFFLFFLLAGG